MPTTAPPPADPLDALPSPGVVAARLNALDLERRRLRRLLTLLLDLRDDRRRQQGQAAPTNQAAIPA